MKLKPIVAALAGTGLALSLQTYAGEYDTSVRTQSGSQVQSQSGSVGASGVTGSETYVTPSTNPPTDRDSATRIQKGQPAGDSGQYGRANPGASPHNTTGSVGSTGSPPPSPYSTGVSPSPDGRGNSGSSAADSAARLQKGEPGGDSGAYGRAGASDSPASNSGGALSRP